MRNLTTLVIGLLIILTFGCTAPNPGAVETPDAEPSVDSNSADVGTDTSNDSDTFTDSGCNACVDTSDGDDTGGTPDSCDGCEDTRTDGGDDEPECGNGDLEEGEQCDGTPHCTNTCELEGNQEVTRDDGTTRVYDYVCRGTQCEDPCKRLRGDFVISSQDDIDFLSSYCEVDGSLEISENIDLNLQTNHFTNLRTSDGNILSLEKVHGTLKIDPRYVESLDGLNNLETVSYLLFTDSERNMQNPTPPDHTLDVSALSELQRVHSHLKMQLIKGTTVEFGGVNGSFSSLESVGMEFKIRGVSAPQPRTFPTFNSLKWVGGDMEVSHVSNFTEVSGFNSLLVVGESLRLANMQGDETCSSSGSVGVDTISGFRKLTYVGGNKQCDQYDQYDHCDASNECDECDLDASHKGYLEGLQIVENGYLETIHSISSQPDKPESETILTSIEESIPSDFASHGSDLFVGGELTIQNNGSDIEIGSSCSVSVPDEDKCNLCATMVDDSNVYGECTSGTNYPSSCNIQ